MHGDDASHDAHDNESPRRADATLVLLVEAEENARLICRSVLGHAGFDVISTGDGPAGLLVCRCLGPAVVVLDAELPTLSGIEFARAVRRDHHLRATPIIALTKRAMVHEQEPLRAAGFTAILVKPIDPKHIVAAVVTAAAKVVDAANFPRHGPT